MPTADNRPQERTVNDHGCHLPTSAKVGHLALPNSTPWCMTCRQDPTQAQSGPRGRVALLSQSLLQLEPRKDNRQHVEIFVQIYDEEAGLTRLRAHPSVSAFCSHGPKLDRYVLRRTLLRHRGVRGDAGSVWHVRLCQGTLGDPDFPLFVADELNVIGLGCDSLCFEIPDVNEPSQPNIQEFTRRLRTIGCTIAVGIRDVERISFQPAYMLSAGFMKFGANVTRDLTGSKTAAARMRAVVRACRELGIQTLAQDVKDQETVKILTDLGVDYAQGRGISEPKPV